MRLGRDGMGPVGIDVDLVIIGYLNSSFFKSCFLPTALLPFHVPSYRAGMNKYIHPTCRRRLLV
jgi:hypothetical protein